VAKREKYACKQDLDGGSSEDEAEKFKAAVEQANKEVRLSEKKVYSKLAKEVNKPRKTTIDFENILRKDQNTEPPSFNNMIKRGYYAKLGIERSPTVNLPVRMPASLTATTKQKESKLQKNPEFDFLKTNKKKNLSSKNLLESGLEIEEKTTKKVKRHYSDCKEESKIDKNNLIEESKEIVDDNFLYEDLTPEDSLDKSMLKRTNTTEGLIPIDNQDASEYIETSFTTKDSGNWRLDLVKKPNMARTGDRIRQDLLSKLTYKKIWLTPSQKPSTHQTVFIYDWDDTLL
jgi:hypothetical protein